LNLILEGRGHVRYFTDMRETFRALGMSASDYSWFVSDIETNRSEEEFGLGDRWISGDELQILLEANPIQFIYAVFSAFPKGFCRTIDASPNVYDNAAYWSGENISTQLPDALFEIACWDSSATILVGLPDCAADSFQRSYPGVKRLEFARK
jgi:hypothetical protein